MGDLILYNGRTTRLDAALPEVSAIAIRDGMVGASGTDQQVLGRRDATTQAIDLKDHRAIPGLNDFTPDRSTNLDCTIVLVGNAMVQSTCRRSNRQTGHV